MRGIAYLTLGNYATVAGLYDQYLTERGGGREEGGGRREEGGGRGGDK